MQVELVREAPLPKVQFVLLVREGFPYQNARTIVIDLIQAVMNTSKVMPEERSASICRNMNDQRRRRAPHPVCTLVPALDAR